MLENFKSYLSNYSFVIFSLFLMLQVISVTHIPISTLAMAVPMKSPDSFVLAIGKGSGSLESWICNLSSSKFEIVGTYNAHDQVVCPNFTVLYDMYQCS